MRTVLSGNTCMPRTVEAKQCSVTCFKCVVVDVQLGGKRKDLLMLVLWLNSSGSLKIQYIYLVNTYF